jgi:hypothetical protein
MMFTCSLSKLYFRVPKVNQVNIGHFRNLWTWLTLNYLCSVFALKSDSTHHFFRNACTKSGSLRFSQFSVYWLILSVYISVSSAQSSVFLSLGRYLCWWPICLRVYHLHSRQCFYHWVDTSADGLFVSECIICTVVSAFDWTIIANDSGYLLQAKAVNK